LFSNKTSGWYVIIQLTAAVTNALRRNRWPKGPIFGSSSIAVRLKLLAVVTACKN